jgi:hypothetical protein
MTRIALLLRFTKPAPGPDGAGCNPGGPAVV